jgi:hypothetical protein
MNRNRLIPQNGPFRKIFQKNCGFFQKVRTAGENLRNSKANVPTKIILVPKPQRNIRKKIATVRKKIIPAFKKPRIVSRGMIPVPKAGRNVRTKIIPVRNF